MDPAIILRRIEAERIALPGRNPAYGSDALLAFAEYLEEAARAADIAQADRHSRLALLLRNEARAARRSAPRHAEGAAIPLREPRATPRQARSHP